MHFPMQQIKEHFIRLASALIRIAECRWIGRSVRWIPWGNGYTESTVQQACQYVFEHFDMSKKLIHFVTVP